MFWNAFICIIMVDTYLYGSEILRRLIIQNIFIRKFFPFFLERICRYGFFWPYPHMLGFNQKSKRLFFIYVGVERERERKILNLENVTEINF